MSDALTREEFKSRLVRMLTTDITRLKDLDRRLRRLDERGQAILQEGKSLLEAVSGFDFGTEEAERLLPDEIINRLDIWSGPIQAEINESIRLAEEIVQLQADLREERSKTPFLRQTAGGATTTPRPAKIRGGMGETVGHKVLQGPPIHNEND